MAGAKRKASITDIPELASLSRGAIKSLLQRFRTQPELLDVATHEYAQGDARHVGSRTAFDKPELNK